VKLLKFLLNRYGAPALAMLFGVTPSSSTASSSTSSSLPTPTADPSFLGVEQDGGDRGLATAAAALSDDDRDATATAMDEAVVDARHNSQCGARQTTSSSKTVSWKDFDPHPITSSAARESLLALCRVWQSLCRQVQNNVPLVALRRSVDGCCGDSENELMLLTRELTTMLNDIAGLLARLQLTANLFRGECFAIVGDFLFSFWSNSLHPLLALHEKDIANLNDLDVRK
jgi:hypothetical protein